MFTRESVRQVRVKLQEHLTAIAAETGLTLTVGDASFSGNEITFKLKAVATSDGLLPGQYKFNLYCNSYGLDAEDFGKSFVVHNMVFTICGINPRATKMPINVKRGDGKVFKFDQSVVNKLHPGRMTRVGHGWMRTAALPSPRQAPTTQPANVDAYGEL